MITTFFDLETRALAADYDNGWPEFMHDGGGGISALVAITDRTAIGTMDPRHESRVELFDDHSILPAAECLEQANRVVSWNGRRFDVPIINTCMMSQNLVHGIPMKELELKEHYDLMQMLRKVTGKNWKLDDVAQATLGRGKTEDPTMAPEMARKGEFGRLFSYCLGDVELLRDIYYEILNGCVVLPDGREITKEELFDDND